MPKYSVRRIAVVLTATCALLLPLSSSAVASGLDGSDDAPGVLAVSSEPSAAAPDGSGAIFSHGAAGVHRFTTHGDNAHVTRGEVSVHGWWTKQSGPAAKARVTVWLQAHKGAKWKTIQKGARTVKPGTGKRANARKKCKNTTTKVKFRTVVDVDIIGYADPPTKLYTKSVTRRCKV